MTNQYIVIVKLDEKIKISQYGPKNGNPAYAGMDILKFLKSNSMEQFKRMLRGVEPYPQEYADHARRNRLKDYTLGTTVLEEVISGQRDRVMVNLFFRRSSFCDWEYIIDLDTNSFLVRKGAEANYSLRRLPSMDQFLEDCNDSY